jgi:hypothetical protein
MGTDGVAARVKAFFLGKIWSCVNLLPHDLKNINLNWQVATTVLNFEQTERTIYWDKRCQTRGKD